MLLKNNQSTNFVIKRFHRFWCTMKTIQEKERSLKKCQEMNNKADKTLDSSSLTETETISTSNNYD